MQRILAYEHTFYRHRSKQTNATKPETYKIFTFFTRDIIYAIARIWYRPYVCPSVCLSVRNTVKVKIMKFSRHGSHIPLVFAGQVSSRNSKGFPRAGASNKGGVGKISTLLYLSLNISKTVADTAKVTIND